MIEITSSQKKYLKGLAHGKKPVVFIGQKHLTDQVHQEIDNALNHYELIKVKCVEFKEKSQKKEIAQILTQRANCHMVGMIGHVLILYRQQPDKEQRKIILPAH